MKKRIQSRKSSPVSKVKAGKPQRPPRKKVDSLSVHNASKQGTVGVATTRKSNSFPIVGVGASAGGLEALEELFRSMPANPGMGFVVVTHQHPGHTSLLPELLGKTAALPVVEARKGAKVEPNRVYVAPPGSEIEILNGVLLLETPETKPVPHLPIDTFLRSLAQDQRERAICIILSGTGTDGSLGLKAIKGESGMAMVQQVSSAKYAGMPSSAVATGLADYVLPAAEMPKQLIAYAHGPYLASTSTATPEGTELPPEPLQKIFLMLRGRTGHDFSAYKANTIRRRIERRMNLHQIKGPNQYVRYLQENAHELDILFKELLISVTSFFRDPEAFRVLADSILPGLLKAKPEEHVLRVWVPGCSSGEEVFSIAIIIRECMEALKRHFEVQIFGTDLDSHAIENARNGLFPDGIAGDVSPKRLDRFFLREDSCYRIRKEIREMTIFVAQNVIKDPPFTKLDLISCRNLLIYLNSDLQKRLLPVFHYALRPGGLLLLGPSETIGGFAEFFEVVDKKWKIFRRKEVAPSVHPVLEFPPSVPKLETEQRGTPAARPVKESDIASIVERTLLNRFAPPSVVVSERGDVVYIHGRTGAYLEPPAGRPRLNILEMAREGLQLELASALRQAAARDTEIHREDIRVKANGDFVYVNLNVQKLHAPETLRGLLLISFQATPAPTTTRKQPRAKKHPEISRIEDLERELQHTKESLQTSIEELETSNEELKSTNEELQSTNEELQSTNEELETSKEEMQSLNEELTTVNTEIQSKVDELSRSNDDMQNLLNSTEIATVFLDNELKIKRYTEQAKRIINLIQTDIGRPVGDLVSTLAYGNLVADCGEVLRSLSYKQIEVQTRDNHWYLMRIMPYRTAENVIDGLVVTFVDTNQVKEAQRSLRRMSKVFTDSLDPIILLDLSGRILELNDESLRTYGWSKEELVGKSIKTLVPKALHGKLEERLRLCRSGEMVRNVESERSTKDGRTIAGVMTLSLLTDEHGQPEAISMITRHGRS